MSNKIEVDTKWLASIMQTFYEMRCAQKDYFAQRSDYRLKVAKNKEAQADAILAEAAKHGYVKAIKSNTTQLNLLT